LANDLSAPPSETDVHISIVNWRTYQLVATCLESIEAISGPPATTVAVVDNESRPGELSALASRFPFVRFIPLAYNAGFAAGTNLGLRSGSGRYALLLNPDTELAPNTLALLVSKLDEDPTLGAAAARLILPDGRTQRSCRGLPSLPRLLWSAVFLDKVPLINRLCGGYMMTSWDHRTERDVEQPAGAFLLIRRECLEDVGFLDEGFHMYFEDVDWCHRALHRGWRIRYFPSATVRHASGGSADQAYARAIQQMRHSLVRYFTKHHGRRAGQLARVLSVMHTLTHAPLWWVLGRLPTQNQSRYDLMARASLTALAHSFEPSVEAFGEVPRG
jgi:N-acetylglucosaminyl-diphospho-decaprenol L-rhamnosyltransferase